MISTATSWNWPMHAGKRRPSWAVNSNLRPSWAVNSSTFNKKCCKKIRVCNIFQRKNGPGGKRSSEYLCKLNDEAALGRVITPSENTNLLEEMILGDNFELQSLTNSALKVDAKKTSKLSWILVYSNRNHYELIKVCNASQRKN